MDGLHPHGVNLLDIPLKSRLVFALDVSSKDAALDLYHRTRSVVGVYKVGLQLFIAEGPRFVDRLRKDGCEVFLDLKLHDIPTTVASAVREASKLGVSLLTVHALGGRPMLEAARDAVKDRTVLPGATELNLLAVSVLTHHTGDSLSEVGLPRGPQAHVEQLVALARDSGIRGCVCSPDEAAAVRAIAGPDFRIVTPGVRPEGAPLADQARSQTPFVAIRDGADQLVVGRPIRTAPDPEAAAAGILEEIERGLAERKPS